MITITRTLIVIITAFLCWKMHANKDKEGMGKEDLLAIWTSSENSLIKWSH